MMARLRMDFLTHVVIGIRGLTSNLVCMFYLVTLLIGNMFMVGVWLGEDQRTSLHHKDTNLEEIYTFESYQQLHAY